MTLKVTPAQQKILQGIAAGKICKEIAKELGISQHVVENQITMCKKNNNCLNRDRLVVLAYAAGLITIAA